MRKISRVVTLIRHAQSKFNADKKHLARNCGLTKKGKSQARKLRGNFDIIFVSPLERSIQTLEYSQLNSLKIQKMNLIREFKRDPCDFFDEELSTKKEDISDCLKRVNTFKKYMTDLPNRYQKICVISHGDFLWHYTSYSLGSETYGYHFDNSESLYTKEP